MENHDLSRRQFLKFGAAAAAAGIVAPKLLAAEGATPDQPAAADATPAKPQAADETPKSVPLEYRVLGRTGLKVTTVSLGCMVAPEEVIAKAFDLGVNYFDTAHVYKNGISEREVGRVLKDKRDKAYICTKIGRNSTAKMLANLDTSLERLQTNYVDVLLLHNAESAGDVTNEAYIAALQKAKKSGKARFIGVSAHTKMPEVINALVDAKIYDVVLTSYNFRVDKNLRDAVARAKKEDIGVVAMKTQAGGFKPDDGTLTQHQAALKWVLDDENITCAVPGTRDFSQLDQNLAVMGRRLGYLERRQLERFAAATPGLYCVGCAQCEGTCPHGVSIPDVRRCAMYLDGYKDAPLAHANYRDVAVNAARCGDCEECTARCARGVALQPILRDTHSRLV